MDKAYANVADAVDALAEELEGAADGHDSLSFAKFAAVVQDAAMLTGQETRTIGRNFRAGGQGFSVDYRAFVASLRPAAEAP